MFKRAKTVDKTNTAHKINKQFTSNPIISNSEKIFSDSIIEKVQKLNSCNDQNLKSEKISEIVNYIDHLSTQELINFMSNENEIIRSFAARSFVDNSSEFSIDKLEFMLKDDNEFVRDSAVMALCYMNSDNMLDLLNEATNDRLNNIKMKAIAGIADIAAEYPDSKAKVLLESFLNNDDPEIRQLVLDELSFLS